MTLSSHYQYQDHYWFHLIHTSSCTHVHRGVLIYNYQSIPSWQPHDKSCDSCPTTVPLVVTEWGEALWPVKWKYPCFWHSELTSRVNSSEERKCFRECTISFNPKVLLNWSPFMASGIFKLPKVVSKSLCQYILLAKMFIA